MISFCHQGIYLRKMANRSIQSISLTLRKDMSENIAIRFSKTYFSLKIVIFQYQTIQILNTIFKQMLLYNFYQQNKPMTLKASHQKAQKNQKNQSKTKNINKSKKENMVLSVGEPFIKFHEAATCCSLFEVQAQSETQAGLYLQEIQLWSPPRVLTLWEQVLGEQSLLI